MNHAYDVAVDMALNAPRRDALIQSPPFRTAVLFTLVIDSKLQSARHAQTRQAILHPSNSSTPVIALTRDRLTAHTY